MMEAAMVDAGMVDVRCNRCGVTHFGECEPTIAADPIRADCRYFALIGGGPRDLLRQVDGDGWAVSINPATGEKFLSAWHGKKIIEWADRGITFRELSQDEAYVHLAGARISAEMLPGVSL